MAASVQYASRGLSPPKPAYKVSMEVEQSLEQVSRQIASADRLLIVAAAGLSISDTLPNNPYHNPDDFALQ